MEITAPNWVKKMSECLTALVRDQVGEACAVVDYELVTDAARLPEEMRVWFILRTRRDQDYFRQIELTRNRAKLTKLMLAAHFPDEAIASLQVRVTSRDEIDGGNFSFSR